MLRRSRDTTRRSTVAVATVLAFALIVASCGGAKEGGSTNEPGGEDSLEAKGLTAADGESGLEEAGEPVRGGDLVYGLEADSNGGYCLSEAQLAISGMMVVRAVYDTLTVPNAEGEFVPYLAESVEPNDDFTEWTITPRSGVKFHDGSDLTAEVIKNNIDAYRGAYEGRSSLLFTFVLSNIAETAVDGDTVKVTMTDPWVAFPAFLFSSSRFGIMAQAQLDSGEECASQPIGTGPFSFVSWAPNQPFKAEKNPDYWQDAPDGEPYPYANSIEFRPISDGQVRANSMDSGALDVMHTANAAEIGDRWYDKQQAGEVNMAVSQDSAEVTFPQLNHTIPPFDDLRMRQAMAYAADREAINEIIGGGYPTIANQPFAPDSIAYVEDPGFPQYDPEKAKALVEEYKADGGDPSFTVTHTTDPTVRQTAQLVQQQAQAVGVDITLVQQDQAALINTAIGKDYQAMLFRNYPGGDPDQNYVWWYSTTGEDSPNPVNFAGIDDPEVDEALDAGRSEPDPEKRKEIYQGLSKRMAQQVHGIWSWYTPWGIIEQSNVHGVYGPPLPNGDEPSRGLAVGHSVLGMWIDS